MVPRLVWSGRGEAGRASRVFGDSGGFFFSVSLFCQLLTLAERQEISCAPGRDVGVQSLRLLPVVSSSDPGPHASIVCWLGDKLTSITTTSSGEEVSEFMRRQDPTNICLTGARWCLSAIRRYLAAVEIVPITHPTAASDTRWFCQEEVNWFSIIKRLSLFCAVSCSSVRFCWNGRWSCPNVAYLLIVSTIVGDLSCQRCLTQDLYFFTLAPVRELRRWFSSTSTSWSLMLFSLNSVFSLGAE